MGQPEVFQSSIGKKAVAAITGLVLFGFVVGHLLGNLQIFMGPGPINAYAEKLRHLGMLLWAVRFFLLLALMIHIGVTLQLARENRRARPVPYKYQDTIQATKASRTMIVSGIGLFAFIVYHLMHFTLCTTNPEFAYLKDSLGRHDVYAMMVLGFKNPVVSTAYVVAIGALCFHLTHGLSSYPQSFGFNNENCMPVFQYLGYAAAFLIFVGYVSIPVAVLLNFVKLL